jgi:hypothetical protein
LTEDLRSNLGTWAVAQRDLPAVAHWMHDALPNEPYDPHFFGQRIDTTYFDTDRFRLRKARKQGEKYCTLRLRCYRNGAYAFSAKTADCKLRLEIDAGLTDLLLHTPFTVLAPPAEIALGNLLDLPADLLALLLDLVGDEPLRPVACVRFYRYAIEDDVDRFTLDVQAATSAGKCLPFSVLEFKSTQTREPPPALVTLGLQPIRISKFLWATEV